MSFYFSYDAKDLYDILEKNLSVELLSKIYNKEKLHCTMLYSNEEYQKDYKQLKFLNQVTKVEKLTVWNTGKDFVLVANLYPEELIKKHNEIKQKFNLETTQDFNPHITLQRIDNENELIPIENFNFLIGTDIELKGFRAIPIKNKNFINKP